MGSMATDRIEFFDFNPDPTVRYTFWTLIFGGYFMWLAVFGVNQTQVQRYMSMPTIKDVRKALFLCFLLVGILDTALYYLGLVIYTRYKDFDPIETGLVKKIDQLVPLFVMDTLGGLPDSGTPRRRTLQRIAQYCFERTELFGGGDPGRLRATAD